MLELMMGGNHPATAGKLKQLASNGTPPANFAPYTSTTMVDRSKNRVLAFSESAGQFTPFDLTTNTWGSAITTGFAIRQGTRVIDSPDGTGLLKWGMQSGSYVARAMFMSGDVAYAASGWSNTMNYPLQVTLNGVVYLFGGIWTYAVDGANTMGVRTYTLANNTAANHGTLNPTAVDLHYQSIVGTDGTNIFCFGGIKSTSGSNTIATDILKYTVASRQWSVLATTMPFVINGGGLAPYYNGKFYFLGSQVGNNLNANGNVYAYTVATGTWETLYSFPELIPYNRGTLFVMNDLLYYFCPMTTSNVATYNVFTISLK